MTAAAACRSVSSAPAASARSRPKAGTAKEPDAFTGAIDTATKLSSAAPARWEALFDCPAPQRLPSLVEQAVAWREQVLLHGDVSPAIAHDLQLAVEHALQQRGVASASDQPADVMNITAAGTAGHDQPLPGTDMSASAIECPLTTSPALLAPAAAAAAASPLPVRRGRAAPLPPAASQLLPGSQLVKAHDGRNHIVTVEADGFRYEGELFASLSAVARHITGTHWNGLLFFGLRKRRSYPPKPRRHG